MDQLPEPKEMRTIQVLDHGFVALDAVMGDDLTPARCARTSFNKAGEAREEEKDRRLTRYLVSHRHTTPLEFCQLRFYMKLPLFVAAQLVRHRTASINQVSYRYVEAKPEFYLPDVSRMERRAEDVKQGSGGGLMDKPEVNQKYMGTMMEWAFMAYNDLLASGLAPEIARIILPQATYTEWYYQMDLHNLIHLLHLRLDDHAQWETRQYAQAMHTLAREAFPTAIEASGLNKHWP